MHVYIRKYNFSNKTVQSQSLFAIKIVRQLHVVLTSHSVKNPRRGEQILTKTTRAKVTYTAQDNHTDHTVSLFELRNQAFERVKVSRESLLFGPESTEGGCVTLAQAAARSEYKTKKKRVSLLSAIFHKENEEVFVVYFTVIKV